MRLIEALPVEHVSRRLSRYLRWPHAGRQRGQGLVEYGLILAVIAVASIAAFNALSAAERGYFGGMKTVVAPTPASFNPLGALTSLVATPATEVYGGTTTLRATLTAGGAPVPGETITFTVNGTAVGSAITDASGLATLSNANAGVIPVGTYTTAVSASFAGDSSYRPANAVPVSLTVNKASTTVTPNNATGTFGSSSVTLTAQVVAVSPSTAPVNEGTVTFTVKDSGGATICTATSTTVSNGTATSTTCNPGAAPTGTYNISATYTGGSNFSGSSSTTNGTLQLTKATPVLAVNAAIGPFQGVASLTATLTYNANPVSGETISFGINGTAVGNATTDATGKATLANASLGTVPLGGPYANAVGASYAGGTNYNAPTTNPVFNSLSITKRNTVVTVVCNPVNPPKDSATSCTATVADDPANGGTSPGTPSGTVQWSFSGGNGGFGVLPGPLSPTTSCPLSAGSCAVSLTPTQAKVYTVIANYQGDSSPDVYNAHQGQTTITAT